MQLFGSCTGSAEGWMDLWVGVWLVGWVDRWMGTRAYSAKRKNSIDMQCFVFVFDAMLGRLVHFTRGRIEDGGRGCEWEICSCQRFCFVRISRDSRTSPNFGSNAYVEIVLGLRSLRCIRHPDKQIDWCCLLPSKGHAITPLCIHRAPQSTDTART